MPTRSRIRLAFLVTRMHQGGAERQMLMLARELRRSHDVVFLTMRAGGPFAGLAQDGGIEVRSLAWPDGRWRDRPVRHVLGIARAAVGYLRAVRTVDVVEAWLPGAYTFAGLMQPLARVPVLIAGRRTMADVSRPRNRWARLAGSMAMRQVHAVVANSEAVARDAITVDGLDPDLIHVIRNGVDPGSRAVGRIRRDIRREWGIGEGEVVVGCVANYRPGKGVEMMIEVADRLRSAPEPLRFVLVGDGPLRGALERRVRDLGLEDVVMLRGHPDATRIYPAFDLVIQASVSEGLPNAILEAAAAGKPIVATVVGGTAEILRDGRNGVLVAPDNPDALAAALLGLVRDPRRQERLGRAARDRAREFSPRALAEQTAELHASLLGVRRGLAPSGRPRGLPGTTRSSD
jgi:glycosyltransferase involved in cell wall biosynthesis